ncbi:MAG: hypothetical protein M1136_12405 [Chloroflexi bacterium]|nr:hypothetical protein [Chloroflexota bacterium]
MALVRHWLFFAILLVAVGGFTLTSCDPGVGITYENQTNRTIAIYTTRHGYTGMQGKLPPYEIHTFSTLMSRDVEPYPILFEAKDEEGNVVWSETLTWRDLEKRGWRIVITGQTLTPTPSPQNRPP